jgi:uncharacterized protein (TIGR03435 family)
MMAKLLTMVACAAILVADVTGAQNLPDLGGRFARTTITENNKPLLKGVIFKDTSDNLIVMGAPLVDVIARAYEVHPYQVIGGPEWVYQAHLYDIEAVPPPAKLVSSDDARMLQSLLADRFKLQIEPSPPEVEALVLDVDVERQRELFNEMQKQREEFKRESPEGGIMEFQMFILDPQTLSKSMAGRAGEPVTDQTGLSRIYLHDEQRLLLDLDALDFEAAVALLKQSGVLIERRFVPRSRVVVTSIEHPRLDMVDR